MVDWLIVESLVLMLSGGPTQSRPGAIHPPRNLLPHIYRCVQFSVAGGEGQNRLKRVGWGSGTDFVQDGMVVGKCVVAVCRTMYVKYLGDA